MSTQRKSPSQNSDTPRDKPVSEHTEHANLERPGAQAHPQARRGWSRATDPVAGWRWR
jgi:hypothetical protein